VIGPWQRTLSIHNNQKSSMHPAGFEPPIPASQLYTARPLVSAQTVYMIFLKITSNSLLHKHQNIITKNKDACAYFLPCFPEFVQKPDASNYYVGATENSSLSWLNPAMPFQFTVSCGSRHVTLIGCCNRWARGSDTQWR